MTIFTRIIAGEIPSYKIYENDRVFVFLDINQYQKGKTLVVSKTEVDHFFDLDPLDYHAMCETARVLAPILQKVFQSKRVWLVIEWLEVPHVHIKLIPIDVSWDIGDEHIQTLSSEEMLDIQQRIVDALPSYLSI